MKNFTGQFSSPIEIIQQLSDEKKAIKCLEKWRWPDRDKKYKKQSEILLYLHSMNHKAKIYITHLCSPKNIGTTALFSKTYDNCVKYRGGRIFNLMTMIE